MYFQTKLNYMCQNANELKLCTCNEVSKQKVNIWMLFTFEPSEQVVMGEIAGDHFERTDSYRRDHLHLCTLLNQKNCFDKPITLKEKDVLKLRLQNEQEEKPALFEFMLTDGEWAPIIQDPFSEFDYKRVGKGGIELL